MAAPTDRVYVLKRETSTRGGTDADEAEYPTIIDPTEDGLVAQGLFLQPPGGPEDENVYLARDSSGNMFFRDSDHGAEFAFGKFLKEYGSALSASQSDTTATTFQQKLRLTATAVAGTYLLCWYCEAAVNQANKVSNIRVQVNDATTLGVSTIRPSGPALWESQSGFQRLVLTASSHNFDLDWNCNVAGYVSSIRAARLVLVRVA